MLFILNHCIHLTNCGQVNILNIIYTARTFYRINLTKTYFLDQIVADV